MKSGIEINKRANENLIINSKLQNLTADNIYFMILYNRKLIDFYSYTPKKEEKMAITWIEHKGKKILEIDHEKTTSVEKIINNMTKSIDHIKGASGKVLCLLNFEGTVFNKELFDFLNSRAKEVAGLREKVAIIGITGIKKVLSAIIISLNHETKAKICNTREKALDWLAE